jgi:hypothetical protein
VWRGFLFVKTVEQFGEEYIYRLKLWITVDFPVMKRGHVWLNTVVTRGKHPFPKTDQALVTTRTSATARANGSAPTSAAHHYPQ